MHAPLEFFHRPHARCAALLAACFLGTSVAEARWEPRDTGTLSDITQVQCLSATDAWATGVGGTVLHSTDGGDHWVSVDSGVTSAYGWNSLHFVNSQVGWFAGIKSTGRTVDAGSSWYRIYLPDLSDPGNPAQNAIFATSETEAWTVGVSYGDVGGGQVVDLLTLWDHKKTDSGMVVGEIQLLAQGVFSDVQFLTPDDGFAVGYTQQPAPDGIIARISNATTDPAFSKQESGGDFYLEGISMVNSTHGFIVGDGGVILYTTNGGETWLAQPSPNNADLYDVFFLDVERGWAVGVNTVLETTDGGAHWRSLVDAPHALLTGVHFCDADHGFIVGDGGTLLKWVVPRCGDGSVDTGEECDAGKLNGQDGACCTSSCTIATLGTVCRPAADECDAPEVCSGSSAACPADEATSEGHACDNGGSCRHGVCTPPRDGESGGAKGDGEDDGGGGNSGRPGAAGGSPSGDAGETNDSGEGGEAGSRPSANGGPSPGSGGHAGASETGAGSSGDGDGDDDNAAPDSGGCGACTTGGRTGSHGPALLVFAGLVSVLAARRRGARRRGVRPFAGAGTGVDPKRVAAALATPGAGP